MLEYNKTKVEIYSTFLQDTLLLGSTISKQRKSKGKKTRYIYYFCRLNDGFHAKRLLNHVLLENLNLDLYRLSYNTTVQDTVSLFGETEQTFYL